MFFGYLEGEVQIISNAFLGNCAIATAYVNEGCVEALRSSNYFRGLEKIGTAIYYTPKMAASTF